ncbi:MAG: ABC transporter permease [Candidatus Puniceispirillaceae bacterium]|jgi:putative spermidine/putrescine transport system permease protein
MSFDMSIPRRLVPLILSLPFATVIFAFFIIPLALVIMVSFWDYNSYSIIPDFIFTNYEDIFYGCIKSLPDLCTSFATYLSSLKFVFIVWLITLVTGFLVALFLAFCVSTLQMQVVLFLLCTIPFWTSNVIRMISWIPLLGRNGLVNSTLQDMGLIEAPFEWLLYSQFSVVLAFVHLYALFMVVPIFNSMMRIDRSLLEAAHDAGATTWQTLTNIIIPLSRPGIIIGSIFVITIVMGDFLTIGVMGGQQIPSVGKIINVEMTYLQFPAAAANAVILIIVTLMIIFAMTKLVDIRKEL